MAEKKKKLTRNDAAELYRDLHKAMSQMKKDETQETKAPINNKVAKQIAEAIRASMKKDDAIRGSGGSAGDSSLSNQIPDEASSYNPSARQATPLHGFSNASGSQLAITFVVFFLLAKVSFSALEFSGVFVVPNANASLAGNGMRGRIPFSTSQYSEAEVTVLKQLDAKRAEMEERVIDLNKREQEMNLKEQEFVARLAEIRDLTEKLKLSREKTEAQRNSKLEQLSNV
ncbi:MAG: hypothetical protein KDD70_06290, partial [Bdellovibrionales bacterium]|nr:hypothetical protein [Bdellovibrionales bacterium]